MSEPAQGVRLHLVLEPHALIRVLDRLAVLDLLPRRMVFERQQQGEATLYLEIVGLADRAAENLRDRLAQYPSVRSVRLVAGLSDSFSYHSRIRLAGGT